MKWIVENVEQRAWIEEQRGRSRVGSGLSGKWKAESREEGVENGKSGAERRKGKQGAERR